MGKENDQAKKHFDIFDWLKKHTIVTCIIIISVLIIIPISFYVPSFIGFIPREEAGNVLGYYGAIIGGALTLLGVWWTIKNQEEQRREDLSIQYKPMLTFKEPLIIKNKHTLIINEEFCFQIKCNEKKLNEHRILIELENVGLGEGYITELDICSLNIAPIKGTNTFIQKFSNTPKTKPIIPINRLMKLGITIRENIPDNISEELIFKVIIKYRDLFNRHIYAKEYDFHFNISTNNNKRTIVQIGFYGKDSQLQ